MARMLLLVMAAAGGAQGLAGPPALVELVAKDMAQVEVEEEVRQRLLMVRVKQEEMVAKALKVLSSSTIPAWRSLHNAHIL